MRKKTSFHCEFNVEQTASGILYSMEYVENRFFSNRFIKCNETTILDIIELAQESEEFCCRMNDLT